MTLLNSPQWLGRLFGAKAICCAKCVHMPRFPIMFLTLVSIGVLPASMTHAQNTIATYTVTDLGGLPGLSYVSSVAFAINDAGEIAGSSYTEGPSGPVPQAVVWARDASGNYAIIELGIISAATGINNNGVVGTNAGFIVEPATVNGNLVWYQDANDDGHNDLAIAISTGGRAVVSDNMQIADGNHLVQFDSAGNEIVTTLPNKGYANSINDSGEVAGYNSSDQATIWQVDAQGDVLSTDTLAMLTGYTMSSALCIDAQGQVAGYSSYFKKNQLVEHATLWQSPASVSSGSTAFLWKNGVMTDLNKSISAPGIKLQGAYAINSHGQIVASASVTVGKNVETHAVLLTPN